MVDNSARRKDELNRYERAIVRNADWFIGRQTREGYVDADGDEFYGLRGDATLIGHSVSVRCLASLLTGAPEYLDSARRSLEWLALRQDSKGGWRRHSAFTLDGAQCVFEGFNTYQRITGDRRYQEVLTKAADRMIGGTLTGTGDLLLSDIIEIGEYAHFSLLAWKTTGLMRFKNAADAIIAHIERNFDEGEGMWRPFDTLALRRDLVARALRPALRFAMLQLSPRGRLVARFADRLASFGVIDSFPQYALGLMDAEALLDALDGSCVFPALKNQTRRAICWTEARCRGPFPGSVVESRSMSGKPVVYPIPIINDVRTAALWPTTCLLVAYCGMNETAYRQRACATADRILATQDDLGGFSNFQNPDGSFRPLQSGNVNYSAAMALWLFNEVYNHGRVKLFTAASTVV